MSLEISIIASHSAFRLFSGWNAEHSVRVGLHLHNFLEVIGLSKRDCAHFALVACIHDIGKLGIPIDILEKRSSLTDAERDIVQQHVTVASDFLNFMQSELDTDAQMLIRNHHENFDGSGYPDNLSGNETPIFVQALRICDFYDAVKHKRRYHLLNNVEGALAIMAENERFFNPKLLALFRANVHTIDKI